MIEQIPLTLIVDDAVVISPATIGLLGHNQALVLVGTHRVLTHGIAEHLGILSHIRIGQIIVAIVLEGEGTLGLTTRQTLETIDTLHLKLTVTPFDGFRRCIVGNLLHVILEFGTTTSTPEQVGIAIRSQKHTRINTINTLDRLWLTNERTYRTISYGHADTKASTIFGCRGEIEIIFPVSVNTVGRPHGIGVRSYPGYFVLGNNHTMVGPIGEVLRREHMVVFHAEPVLTLPFGRQDVVRRIDVHLIIKYACSGISRKLITDNRVLCPC